MKVPVFQENISQYFTEILSIGSERRVADLAVNAIQGNKDRFDFVLEMCFTLKYPMCMRAARVIQLYCERDLSFFIPRLDEIMKQALSSEVEGVRRNFLKIVDDFVDFKLISDSGFLLDKCFELLMDPSEKPAIRNHCLHLVHKFALTEEVLARELEEVLEFLEEEPTISFSNCKAKVLNQLKMKRFRG
ncbi:MAG: hypothetical protein AB9842_00800 [Bacteroidales bacterium]